MSLSSRSTGVAQATTQKNNHWLELDIKTQKRVRQSTSQPVELRAASSCKLWLMSVALLSIAMAAATPLVAQVKGEGQIPLLKPSQEKIRIRVATWNLGENKRTQSAWFEAMKKSWGRAEDAQCNQNQPLTRWCFDILVFSVQEDYKGETYGRFPEAIGKYLGDEWKMEKSIVEGPPEPIALLNKSPFTVKMYVFVNKQFAAQRLPGLSFDFAGVCLQRNLKIFCSKGTAGVSMNVPGKGQVILMGSHFPVNTKDKATFGYEQRITAISTSLKEVFKTLRKPNVQNVLAIWAGDMNFRANTMVSDGRVVADQLKTAQQSGAFNVEPSQIAVNTNDAISTPKNVSIKNSKKFVEMPLEFPPTCRLRECTSKLCPVCDRSKTENMNRLDNEAKEKCYDDRRIPSYCDRILFYVSGESVSLVPIEYKSWSTGQGIEYSDHNLVWADFRLDW